MKQLALDFSSAPDLPEFRDTLGNFADMSDKQGEL